MKRSKIHKKDIENARKEGIPIYYAEKYHPTKVRMWCPFCVHYHSHGGLGLEPFVLEHRAAHCNESRTYHPKGYYFVFFPENYKKSAFT